MTRAVLFGTAALLCSCGYRLVDTSRTIHVALAAEGAVHPEALPAVSEALAARLRDEGLRLSTGTADAELDVVLSTAAERAGVPAEDAEGSFRPSAWEAALEARATLRRAGAGEVNEHVVGGAAGALGLAAGTEVLGVGMGRAKRWCGRVMKTARHGTRDDLQPFDVRALPGRAGVRIASSPARSCRIVPVHGISRGPSTATNAASSRGFASAGAPGRRRFRRRAAATPPSTGIASRSPSARSPGCSTRSAGPCRLSSGGSVPRGDRLPSHAPGGDDAARDALEDARIGYSGETGAGSVDMRTWLCTL